MKKTTIANKWILVGASIIAMATAPALFGGGREANAYFSAAHTYDYVAQQVEESVQPVTDDASMSVVAQDGRTSVGNEVSVSVVISSAPAGVAGFSIQVSLSTPAIARIASVDFPEFGLTSLIQSSDSSVRISAADLFREIEAGEIDSVLGTIHIAGFAPGTTSVELSIIQMDDDAGDIMQPQIVAGTVNID